MEKRSQQNLRALLQCEKSAKGFGGCATCSHRGENRKVKGQVSLSYTERKRRYPVEKYRAGYIARHKRLGLCVACSGKASSGFVHCLQCRRMRWKVFLSCRFCGRNITIPRKTGTRLHEWCKIKYRRLRGRIKWARLSRTPAYIKGHQKATKKYQRKHKRLGLCKACPRPAVRGVYCLRHKK